MTQQGIIIGAVGLVKERIRGDGQAMVCVGEEFDVRIKESNWLAEASFAKVGLIFRYGLENGEPKIERINRRCSTAEVAIEMVAKELEALDFEELCGRFREAILEILIAVGEHFDLETELWRELQRGGQ